MPSYTNTTKQSLDFVIGGSEADPKFASLKPGETKDLNLREEHPAVAGALHSGALVREGDQRTRKSRAEAVS